MDPRLKAEGDDYKWQHGATSAQKDLVAQQHRLRATAIGNESIRYGVQAPVFLPLMV